MEDRSTYQRMNDLRNTDKHTNGTVIKPFKSAAGVRALFIARERVSVQKSKVQDKDGLDVFYVTGVHYDVKTGSFKMKMGLFNGAEKLARYINMTGDFVEIEEPKTRTYKTKFRARKPFKTMDGFEVAAGTEITKTQKMFETAVEDEVTEVDGKPVLIEGQKLATMCEIVEPITEVVISDEN